MRSHCDRFTPLQYFCRRKFQILIIVHFLNYVDEAIKKNWDRPAGSNYGAKTYTYGDMAAFIEKMHLLFEKCGIKKGDKCSLSMQSCLRTAR